MGGYAIMKDGTTISVESNGGIAIGNPEGSFKLHIPGDATLDFIWDVIGAADLSRRLKNGEAF